MLDQNFLQVRKNEDGTVSIVSGMGMCKADDSIVDLQHLVFAIGDARKVADALNIIAKEHENINIISKRALVVKK